MALFEVGKEYWVSYGTTDEQEFACVKVLEVEGSWLRVESDKLDSHLNMAAPLFISARERDRDVERKFDPGRIGDDGWPEKS